MRYLQPLSAVYLYDEPDAAGLDVERIAGFLASMLPKVQVVPRTDYYTHQFTRFSVDLRAQLEREMVRQLQAARIPDSTPAQDGPRVRGAATDAEDTSLIFDAPSYQSILRLLTDEPEARSDSLHVIFTNNGLASRPAPGEKPGLHIICMGVPSIISLSGLVEALPRPREYEFRRAQLAMIGASEQDLEDLAEQFADRTFGYGDARINELCMGYSLMACVYRMTGEAFCPDPDCRLHAARDQQQLIELHCSTDTGLCDRHQETLRTAAQD